MARPSGIFTGKHGFSAAMTEFRKRFEENTGRVIILATQMMVTQIIKSTPYLTGRAQAHWRVALNGRPGGYSPTLTSSPNPPVDISPIQGWKPGDNIHIYNKAPYAYKLEYLGWSSQSPSGMMRVNIIKWPDFVSAAAGSLGL